MIMILSTQRDSSQVTINNTLGSAKIFLTSKITVLKGMESGRPMRIVGIPKSRVLLFKEDLKK